MKPRIKMMYINNEPYDDRSKMHLGSRSYLLFYLYKKTKFLGVGKYNFYKFYQKYKQFKPDIIVCDWVPAGFIPVFLKRIGLIKCPIIHRWEDYYAESMTNYPKFIVSFMEKYTAENADYLITHFKTIFNRSEEIGKQIFLLPYGITPGNKKTKIILDKLKTRKDNLKIIYLGEINHPYKKVDKLIEICKKINCDLFLFGEEPSEYIKKIIGDNKNIHYQGWAPSDEVTSILKQGDILVNLANHDLSYKFIDYINARKPILALNDKPANFFKHKKTAYLTNDFIKGLIELVKNKKLRKKIEKNTRSIKLYTWNQVADIHLALYKKIISGEKNLKEFETSYYHVNINKK